MEFGLWQYVDQKKNGEAARVALESCSIQRHGNPADRLYQPVNSIERSMS